MKDVRLGRTCGDLRGEREREVGRACFDGDRVQAIPGFAG